jgi:hypothetical protein
LKAVRSATSIVANLGQTVKNEDPDIVSYPLEYHYDAESEQHYKGVINKLFSRWIVDLMVDDKGRVPRGKLGAEAWITSYLFNSSGEMSDIFNSAINGTLETEEPENFKVIKADLKDVPHEVVSPYDDIAPCGSFEQLRAAVKKARKSEKKTGKAHTVIEHSTGNKTVILPKGAVKNKKVRKPKAEKISVENIHEEKPKLTEAPEGFKLIGRHSEQVTYKL